ncbi:15-hydroxyprostaglandin dehydrogenase [NAD(+)]-like isoform X1 [Neodiprion fabricii]|uniref:15-hydroxyprostaglandin dehydrogenase [NAD(+)]-like isoform X1 n=1 Tax=Neodiprion fabricii TaxID=2872261 RepID=UPI001ED93CB2|nr:15-hydroxyprostaglandin dehydrogenase [NAD(+)]-like isoform X1 [Neodiprion fabricii]XP_046433539.1 15-hydroxyprostaglandin dehydrogenase [NAD(+)]-like isoform X1 [Neodiprion fabricii]
MQIKNKIVLLTGGANGIGFAYARELLRNGAGRIAILDVKDSSGKEAASKLNKEFGQGHVIFIFCDVSKPQELEAGFAETIKQFGGLDILINNAGIMDDVRWELMIATNVNAVVRGTLLGLQYMGKDKGGKGGVIINIASILGSVPSKYFPIYTGTKYAVIGLSQSFAMPYHYEKTGVRILTLCPGLTDTESLRKSQERMLDITDVEELVGDSSNLTSQKVDSVAHGLVYMIRSAQNSTVWVAENGEPVYQIMIPDRLLTKVSA